jgi:hypothetical protein
MPVTKVIQYKTKPGSAEENERLIRAVFAELAAREPAGVRYAAFRLADGVSFLHVVTLDSDDNPLTALPAFAEFQADIAQRFAEGPSQSDGTAIGSYRPPAT